MNTGDAARDCDANQAGTELERIVPDAGNTIWDYDIGQARAIKKSVIFNIGDAIRNRYAGQTRAICEYKLPDAGNSVERNICHACAVFKRPVPDISDTVGNRDVGEVGAASKRKVLNAGNVVGDRNEMCIRDSPDAHRNVLPAPHQPADPDARGNFPARC